MKALLMSALIALCGPATALTCVLFDLRWTCQNAADSEDSYVVVYGRLSFNSADLQVTDMADQRRTKPDNRRTGRIQGHALDDQGYVVQFEKKIVLNGQSCGPWCATLQNETDYPEHLHSI